MIRFILFIFYWNLGGLEEAEEGGGGPLFCRGPLVTGVKVAHLLETLTTVVSARLNWVASIVSVDFQKTFVPHCESHAVACRSLLHATSMRKVLHDALPLFGAPCLKVVFNRPKEGEADA